MKPRKLERKLSLNKRTIVGLNRPEMSDVDGGVLPKPYLTYDKYTCTCTAVNCENSYAGNNCILTNWPDMQGCPQTMTLCGKLYCP